MLENRRRILMATLAAIVPYCLAGCSGEAAQPDTDELWRSVVLPALSEVTRTQGGLRQGDCGYYRVA